MRHHGNRKRYHERFVHLNPPARITIIVLSALLVVLVCSICASACAPTGEVDLDRDHRHKKTRTVQTPKKV